ncbi:MAG TPA: aldehyde dehydrogenase [Phycisphaerales bacterium]|nr:aldehyde dehydrogenase [Phycisphaerales bacterium]
MNVRIQNLIDGELVEPISGAYLDNIEPATGKSYAHVPDSDSRDVERAVDAAERAFPGWAAASASERSRLMLRIADLIDRDLDALAWAETIDNGKPLALSRSIDIPRAASNMRFFATAILHTHTESHATDSRSGRALNYTLRQPRGVAGAISPWNLPLYLFTWKIAPALATGNTVVAKPSEITPMTAYLFAKLCVEAGLPPGVLNIVHGLGPKVGAAIVSHPRVPAISFTGGTATGAAIAREAAPMFKKLSLELGGKNPNIIFADADMNKAIETAVRAGFANQGQICLSGSRIFVERSAMDAFLPAFCERVKKLTTGDPLEEGVDQGAVVSQPHMEKVLNAIDRAKGEGGTILCGGGRVPATQLPARCRDGYFIQPTVITNLPFDARTNQEEVFGPVVTVTPFDDETQVIGWANSTPYGLAATIWTNNLTRAHRVAERVQAGIIWINCWLLRDLRTPFGGMKQSGVGREGGDEALHFFTEPKNVCIRLDG